MEEGGKGSGIAQISCRLSSGGNAPTELARERPVVAAYSGGRRRRGYQRWNAGNAERLLRM